MDCERRLLHGQKNGLASAKARPNTLWMYCPVQPWILQLNWARDPPPVVLGICQAPSYRSSAGSRCHAQAMFNDSFQATIIFLRRAGFGRLETLADESVAHGLV